MATCIRDFYDHRFNNKSQNFMYCLILKKIMKLFYLQGPAENTSHIYIYSETLAR